MGNQQVRPVAVSTHSRLKAAGPRRHRHAPAHHGFNTQPPEGGWPVRRKADRPWRGFNTQPPEGGWTPYGVNTERLVAVSTHSRLKAAGGGGGTAGRIKHVSTHSRLKAAGWRLTIRDNRITVSTHSRLKAAGMRVSYGWLILACFNAQPPEGGWSVTIILTTPPGVFQHTAA